MDFDKHLEQLAKGLKKISLTPQEKESIWHNLLSYTKEFPVRGHIAVGHETQRGANLSHKNSLFAFFGYPSLTLKRAMPIFILVALLVGGGASLAAENSLPGDTLYPLKVKVNEEVRAWAALSPEAKAEWQSVLAERRLKEAEKLASEGRIDSEVFAKLEAKFNAHADKVNARIGEFEDKDIEAAADVASNFETSLNAHGRILEKLQISKPESKEQLGRLLVHVKTKVVENSKTRGDAETKISGEVKTRVEVAAKGRLSAAENKIKEVKEFIASIENRLGAEATLEAKAKLAIAEQKLVQGKTKLDAGLYNEAFILFGEAHRAAQEAKLLIESRQDLRIIINTNTGLDNDGTSINAEAEVKTESRLKLRGLLGL